MDFFDWRSTVIACVECIQWCVQSSVWLCDDWVGVPYANVVIYLSLQILLARLMHSVAVDILAFTALVASVARGCLALFTRKHFTLVYHLLRLAAVHLLMLAVLALALLLLVLHHNSDMFSNWI
jgi:hypothetical protein